MCKLNPDFGTKRCPITGPLWKKMTPGPGIRKYMGKKTRKMAQWVYSWAFKLIMLADKIDPPAPEPKGPNNVRDILKNNFERIVPFNNVRH